MEDLNKLSKEQLVERLRVSQEKNKLRPTFKVGAKGGISVGGIGQRFPTTLYQDSWIAVLDHADELRAFIKANAGALAPPKH